MSEELKPCPFCGGKAAIEIIKPRRRTIAKVVTLYAGGVFVECTGCGCAISAETETEAIEKWDRRMNDETD